MGDAVGHEGRLEGRPLQSLHQLQGGAARVHKDKVAGLHKPGGHPADALLLGHGLLFLGGHGGLLGEESAVRQGGPAVAPVQPPLLVEQNQIPPDGGFAGVQRVAQLLDRHRSPLCQQFEDVVEPFFRKHGGDAPFLAPIRRPPVEGFD